MNAPHQRYELRKLSSGWSVWDRETDAPANISGRWQEGLSMEDADDLTDLLNHQIGDKRPS